MSDQEQEGPAVEATGTLTDGRITVQATLGGADLSFSWDADSQEEAIDVLLGSAPTIGMAVVNRLLEAEGADRG